MWRNIKRLIDDHHRFLLTTHVNPDGDGIGSACALTELLLQLGKHARFVVDSPIPPRLRFLDYHQKFEEYDPLRVYDDIDVMIVLDAHRRERIGRVATLLDLPGIQVACIDHHSCSNPLSTQAALDPDSCATGAMVYTLYRQCGYDLNARAAAGVYTGVISDTGRFSYSSTSRKAHKIADDCIKIGVDPEQMHRQLFQQVPVEHVRLLGSVLQQMSICCEGRAALFRVTQIDMPMGQNAGAVDLEYLLDFAKSIEGIECVILLRQLSSGGVRISLRSIGALDVGQLLKVFGGGGHPKAAGALVDRPLPVVEDELITLVEEELSRCLLPSPSLLV